MGGTVSDAAGARRYSAFFDGWLWLLGGGAVAALTQENEAAYEVRNSAGEHFRTCTGVSGGVHVHEGRVFLRSKGEID